MGVRHESQYFSLLEHLSLCEPLLLDSPKLSTEKQNGIRMENLSGPS